MQHQKFCHTTKGIVKSDNFKMTNASKGIAQFTMLAFVAPFRGVRMTMTVGSLLQSHGATFAIHG